MLNCKGRSIPRYTVYDNRTDFPICVCETAKRCAELMGITPDTFRHAANNCKGRGNRWFIIKEKAEDRQ